MMDRQLDGYFLTTLHPLTCADEFQIPPLNTIFYTPGVINYCNQKYSPIAFCDLLLQSPTYCTGEIRMAIISEVNTIQRVYPRVQVIIISSSSAMLLTHTATEGEEVKVYKFLHYTPH